MPHDVHITTLIVCIEEYRHYIRARQELLTGDIQCGGGIDMAKARCEGYGEAGSSP